MEQLTEKTRPAPVGVVPISLVRPILTPPRNDGRIDPPLYAYVCPHNGIVELITEELTILPTVVEAKKQCLHCLGSGPTATNGQPTPCPHIRATVLSLGDPIFVGAHLLRGHPDKLPDALLQVLEHHFEDDLTRGQRSRWLLSPAIRHNGEEIA